PPTSPSPVAHVVLPTAFAVPRTPERKQSNYSTSIHLLNSSQLIILSKKQNTLSEISEKMEVIRIEEGTVDLKKQKHCNKLLNTLSRDVPKGKSCLRENEFMERSSISLEAAEEENKTFVLITSSALVFAICLKVPPEHVKIAHKPQREDKTIKQATKDIPESDRFGDLWIIPWPVLSSYLEDLLLERLLVQTRVNVVTVVQAVEIVPPRHDWAAHGGVPRHICNTRVAVMVTNESLTLRPTSYFTILSTTSLIVFQSNVSSSLVGGCSHPLWVIVGCSKPRTPAATSSPYKLSGLQGNQATSMNQPGCKPLIEDKNSGFKVVGRSFLILNNKKKKKSIGLCEGTKYDTDTVPGNRSEDAAMLLGYKPCFLMAISLEQASFIRQVVPQVTMEKWHFICFHCFVTSRRRRPGNNILCCSIKKPLVNIYLDSWWKNTYEQIEISREEENLAFKSQSTLREEMNYTCMHNESDKKKKSILLPAANMLSIGNKGYPHPVSVNCSLTSMCKQRRNDARICEGETLLSHYGAEVDENTLASILLDNTILATQVNFDGTVLKKGITWARTGQRLDTLSSETTKIGSFDMVLKLIARWSKFVLGTEVLPPQRSRPSIICFVHFQLEMNSIFFKLDSASHALWDSNKKLYTWRDKVHTKECTSDLKIELNWSTTIGSFGDDTTPSISNSIYFNILGRWLLKTPRLPSSISAAIHQALHSIHHSTPAPYSPPSSGDRRKCEHSEDEDDENSTFVTSEGCPTTVGVTTVGGGITATGCPPTVVTGELMAGENWGIASPGGGMIAVPGMAGGMIPGVGCTGDIPIGATVCKPGMLCTGWSGIVGITVGIVGSISPGGGGGGGGGANGGGADILAVPFIVLKLVAAAIPLHDSDVMSQLLINLQLHRLLSTSTPGCPMHQCLLSGTKMHITLCENKQTENKEK
ncbi:hypothetical protein C0J52_16493, partial [Blattella germanica]